MKNYVKESAIKALNNRNEFYLLSGSIPVYIINKLPPHINIKEIIKQLEKNIPPVVLKLIDGIYIGEFKELKERDIEAMFKDGVIYLSSFKENPNVSEETIIKDICHELAHAMEDSLGQELYSDGKLEQEYNGKKQKLFSLLTHEGYHFAKEILFADRLIKHLDDLLYHEIGYDKLSLIIPGLFTSPYSITSIREYFANGMEDYLLGNSAHLKKTSPVLYNKLDSLYQQINF